MKKTGRGIDSAQHSNNRALDLDCGRTVKREVRRSVRMMNRLSCARAEILQPEKIVVSPSERVNMERGESR
jgi:hypothetical protein